MNYKEYIGTIWTRAGKAEGRKVFSIIIKYIDDNHIFRDVYSIDSTTKSVTLIRNDDIMGKEMDTMIMNGMYHQVSYEEKKFLLKSLFENVIIIGRR